MRKTIRLMLALVAVLGLVFVAVTPASADLSAGVVVFTGTAEVGTGLLPGDGLCIPGLNPATGCTTLAPIPVPANGWTFAVPGTLGNCIAAGQFSGAASNIVAGSDLVVDTSCAIASSGTVDGTEVNPLLPTIGPTCGNSHGWTTSAVADIITLTPDAAPSPPFIAAAATVYPFEAEWPTSAGGSLPLIGQVELGAPPTPHEHYFAGLVQARPISAVPGVVPCVNAAATSFTIAGVIAVSA